MSFIFLLRATVLLLLAGDATCMLFIQPTGVPQHYLGDRVSFDDDSWHKYVRAPSSRNVSPSAVVQGSVSGNVSNPAGLIDGNNPTVLTRRTTTDTIPSLVVDFGQNLAGYLRIDLQGSTDSPEAFPGIRLAFSETLQHLSDSSDFTRSYNADGGDVRVSPRQREPCLLRSPYRKPIKSYHKAPIRYVGIR